MIIVVFVWKIQKEEQYDVKVIFVLIVILRLNPGFVLIVLIVLLMKNVKLLDVMKDLVRYVENRCIPILFTMMMNFSKLY